MLKCRLTMCLPVFIVLLTKCIVSLATDDTWMLKTDRLPMAGDQINYSEMTSVGNGHIATVISSPTLYMNGFFNRDAEGGSYRAGIPSQHDISVTVAGQTNTTHTLDMWKGMFITRLETPTAIIHHMIYAHQHYTQLMVSEILIERLDGVTDNITVFLTHSDINSTTDVILDMLSGNIDVDRCPSTCYMARGTTTSSYADIGQVYMYWTHIPENITLHSDMASKKWTFFTSIDADQERAKTVFQSGAFRLYEAEIYNNPDILTDSHLSAWSSKWNQGRVEVTGNDDLSRLVHSSQYYILSSLPSTDPNQPNEQFYGLSSGGLAHGGMRVDFQGHVTSNMETWMYPPVLLMYPQLAKAMLSYRINSMDNAYNFARDGGYEGLRYPHEGGPTGDNVSPGTCMSCDQDVHTTGDIAFAARLYVAATRDVDWLSKEEGYIFIRDLAKFLKSRAVWNQAENIYEIKGVAAADNGTDLVDNSVYTNVGAINSIRFARYAACLTDLAKFDDIDATWLNVAEKMLIPFDEDERYHPVYEGFNPTTGDSPVSEADAIMLGYPLMFDMPDDVRRNDLSIYQNYTQASTRAMTWAMFAVNWLEVGEPETAAEMFRKSYEGYVQKPFPVWSTPAGDSVNFLAGMGSFLQTLIFGYAGARLHPERLDLDPQLPPNSTSLRLVGIDYLGNSFDLTILESKVIVVVQNRSETGYKPLQLRLKTTGTEWTLKTGKEIPLPREAFSIYTVQVSDCPVPEGSSCPPINTESGEMRDVVSQPGADKWQYVVVSQTGGNNCTDNWSCKKRVQSLMKVASTVNFYIGEDGRIYEGRGWDVTDSFDERMNKTSLNFAAIGDFTCTKPTALLGRSILHLLKCGMAQGYLDPQFILLSERQLQEPAEHVSDHDRLTCQIMKSRHWKEYQRGGSYQAPLCHGECFQPIPRPDTEYTDLSDQPTIFQTDRLPMVDDTEEIDYNYMASVGNGHVATIAYSPTIYINGLFNGPTGWSHRARIPSTQALRASLTAVDEMDVHRLYSLDVKKAVFEETITSPDVTVTLRLYAHQYYTRLLVSEVMVHRHGDDNSDISVSLSNHPGDDSTDIAFNPEIDITDNYEDCTTSCIHQSGVTLITESNNTEPGEIHIFKTQIPQTVVLPGSLTNKTWVFFTSLDLTHMPARESFIKGLSILKEDPEGLYKSHVEAWRKRWGQGVIEMEGDVYLSKRIYGSFYYLLSFLPAYDPYIRNNQFFGLSPGGLANGANWTDYQGHVFWDMETWMYPTMLMFHPELGKEMLSYRTYAMQPAYERAAEGGYSGIRFPWESALSGVEQTPDICVPCRKNQLHITGDIGLAAKQYVAVTRDTDWLAREQGFQMIRDMALFWATRPTYDADRDTYSINGVMPPDEHALSINNSVYTNVGAKLSVYFARYAACLAGRNATEEVPDHWLRVADKLHVPFNQEKQYHPEFEGFEDWTDERGVKQADAIMLGYPQMWPMSETVRRNDLVAYEKVTNPLGPAMTWGMFAIGWLELGDEHKANQLFHKSYSPYVREPFKVWTEARSGIGAVNFITGMGGFLQALFFGYGGARIYTEHMEFEPRIPPGNKALRFRGMNYLGNSLDIEIYADKVSVIARDAKSTDHPLILTVKTTGAEFSLQEGKEIIIGREAFSIRTHKVTDCPLPKDEILREKNCPSIVPRATWGASEGCETEDREETASYVVVDHTDWGTCDDFHTCVNNIQHIQMYHRKKQDFVDISYNFLIGQDGRLYEGRGWDTVPALPTNSTQSLSIGLVGSFKCDKPSPRMQETLMRLIKCGIELGKIDGSYDLVGGMGPDNDMTSVPLSLHCQLRSWHSWRSDSTTWESECDRPCDASTPTLPGALKDISPWPHIFTSNGLPKRESSNEIDFRYMPSVGNGHLATVVFSPTVYVNGLFNGPTGWSHRARIPSLNAFHVTVVGVTEEDTVRTCSLDVLKATFTETIETPLVTIEHRVYAHQFYVRLLVTEMIVTRKAESEGSDVVINIWNEHQSNFSSEDIEFDDKVDLGRPDLCPDWRCWRIKGRTLIPETENTPLQDIYIAWYEIPDNVTLGANKNQDRWVYMTAIDQTIDRSNMNFEAGRRDFIANQDLLYQRHVEAWTEKWDNGYIHIKDNIQLAKLVYGSFYYILSSLPAEKTYLPTNQFYGLSPGGLANGANLTDYQGHVFWDMETWMYPGILMFHPDLAKAMLSYRIYSMPPSYARAESGGYEGLRYPWEGAGTGAEVTPDICIPCRENQQHITGDIAFAARQYVSATRDIQWLKQEKGYQFIKDMGRFWATRPSWNEDKQAYEINGVMPPDEHQLSINNSVYTNVGAKLSLLFANYAACLVGDTANTDWTDIANKIYLPFDEFKKYHPEFEGYEDATGEKAVVKQADAILLGFPQMWPMDETVRKNDLEMYEKVTNPLGPAMTWGMFSIGWLELGNDEKAKEMFHKSYSLYTREPFKVWTEARSGIGAVNFITGMGGLLQSVLFGYGGLRLHVEQLEFDPKVIPGTSGMLLVSLNYLGNTLDIDVSHDTVRVVKTQSSEHEIELIVKGSCQRLLLETGNEMIVSREAFTIRGVDTTECPLPEGKSCPKVITRDEWKAMKAQTSVTMATEYENVVVYQTGGHSCDSVVECKRAIYHIQEDDMKMGNTDIRYNFLLDDAGNVYDGRGWDSLVELEGQYTSNSLVVGFVGDYTCEPPSERAMAGLKRLLKCGVEMKKVSSSYKLVTERQVGELTCATPNCLGDHLLCAVMTLKHWKPEQVGGEFKEPNCQGLCQIEPASHQPSASLYTDISDDPDVFTTDRLPTKPTGDTDFRYMASVGNGHIATLVKSDTIYMNGFYNGPKGWSHRARIPATQALTISPVGGEQEGRRLYSLHVKQGMFQEDLMLSNVKVTQRTYAHQYYNRLLVTDVVITRTGEMEGDVVFDVVNNHGPESEDITFQEPEQYISDKYRMQQGETHIPEIAGDSVQSVVLFYTVIPSTITFTPTQDSSKFTFFTSIDHDRYGAQNNFDEALRIHASDPDLLYKKHVEEWEKKWSTGRIDVDGNIKLSKIINSCFYYLLSFLPAMNTFLPNYKTFGGLSPGGLANGANWTDYQGHVFWDMETWMYPTMLMFHPELGKEMLSYRITNMEPAYDRAKSGGYEGLRYPWESSLTGVEVTPDICPKCRDNQQHVTGDIALAARQYVSATRDIDWLNGKKGYVFIKDMARFWKSRPTYNPDTGMLDINGVMPPDEHAESVNNSVYTNVGAKLSINFARYAACLSGRDPQQEVPDDWIMVAKNITLLFDEEQRFHPEYEGYTDEKDPRGVKQADVVLLGYPQMWPMSEDVRRNDLIRYERVNNPLGPAMTWGMFSIAWLELGDQEQAAEMFERSYALYTRQPFKIWTEARSGIGAVNFLTGMGGFLQAVFFGYGGARLHTESLDFDPRLPPDTRGMRFVDFDYLGNTIHMDVKDKLVTILVKAASEEHKLLLVVKKTGAIFRLKQGEEFVLPRQPFSLHSQLVTPCPLPEEDSCPQMVDRDGWQAMELKTALSKLNSVSKVVLHQTGHACETEEDCKRQMRHIQLQGGADDISYNFLVGGDGRVYEGRGWGAKPRLDDEDVASDALSIALMGEFTCTSPDELYIHALMRLLKCGVEKSFLAENYVMTYENEVTATECTASQCPGDRLVCRLHHMKHWSTAPSREPDCSTPCAEQGERTSVNLYPDTGTMEHVFETDKLPMAAGSDNLDTRYMASVANGHLGTVVYSDTIYVNGLFNGPFGWSHRARIPSTQAIRVQIDGEPDAKHHFALNTKRAVFEETVSTNHLEVTIRTYAHQKFTRLLVTEIEAQRRSDRSDQVTLTLTNNRGDDTDDITFSEPQPYGNEWFRTGKTKQTETEETEVSNVSVYYTNLPPALTLPPQSDASTWVFYTAIDKNQDVARAAFDGATRMLSNDVSSLYTSHVEAWDKRWSRGSVVVEGNTLMSKLINGCFYYLLSFLPAFEPDQPNDQFFGLSPGGLANGANWTDYQGHVFWDMETWMYPGILVLHPELAKEMLSYRIHGMKEAYKRAKEGGYSGLRYPWESAFTGAEQTPDICVPCRENQQHITGDIALAARQYLTMTRDMQWLKEEQGFPFIRDMGEFWTSRVEWNEQTQKYDINGVMPPDEHALSVNNSVYTNIGAKLSIHFARYAACLSERKDNVSDDWTSIADKIDLLYDPVNKVHPEYLGYQDGNDERGVKQADVILMGYPQMWPIDPEVRRNDLVKYEKVTNVMGPAMTWGMFSIGWLELGEEEIAEDLFHRSYRPYVREPFRVWTEARAGIGAVNFITAMGGFLQSVIFGYGGLRIHTEHLSFNPRVLPASKGLFFNDLDYLGNTLDIRIRPDHVSVVNRHASPDMPLILRVDATEAVHHLKQDMEVLIARQPFTIRTMAVSDCPLPEESSCPEVVQRVEWGSSPIRPLGTVSNEQHVVVYQTGGEACYSKHACVQRIHNMQQSLRSSGKTDLVHNFLIGSEGRVYEGRGWNAVGDFSDNYNSKSIGVAIIGDFTSETPSELVIAQLQRLIKCGLEAKKLASNYTLLWQEQITATTSSSQGDMLLCRLMQFKHWVNHQTGGVFKAPNCEAPSTHVPDPTSPTSASTPTAHTTYTLLIIICITAVACAMESYDHFY